MRTPLFPGSRPSFPGRVLPALGGILLASLWMSACISELPVGAVDAAPEQSPEASSSQGSGQAPDPGQTQDPETQDPQPSPQEPDPGNSPKPEPSPEPSPEDKIACELPVPRSCDDTPCHCLSLALGIGCYENGSETSRPEIATHTNYDQQELSWTAQELPSAFAPTEGARAVILGTGPLADFRSTPRTLRSTGRCDLQKPEPGVFDRLLTCPSQDTPEAVPGHALPGKLTFDPVDPSGKVDCWQDKSLVGTGDCSNSMQQLVQNKRCWDDAPAGCTPQTIHDAAAFSLQITVPPGITSMSFDSAFLSAEYPFNYKSPAGIATDALVVWLESKDWSGNLLMDDANRPMTVDNAWLRLKDAQNREQDCPFPCNEHKLHQYAMAGHGATPWLTTEFPVRGGERILLTFAVLEFGSPLLDTYALIDNVRWGCTEKLEGPVTRLAK